MTKYLIDGKIVADKIDNMINSVIDKNNAVANGLLMANQEICKACIEDRVEAIPVEWLEKRIKELDTELHSLYSRFCSQEGKESNEAMLKYMELCLTPKAYETVLSEWRKENGLEV